MNNTNTNMIDDYVNKIPITLYFSTLPDREQTLKYINWIYTNIPQSKNDNQDILFRSVISKHLRIVGMKILNVDILFLVALNTITLEDFKLDSKVLITKVMNENKDKYDLDMMYRVLAQIMTKIPKDLKDKITNKQKKQIFQEQKNFNFNKIIQSVKKI